MGRLIVIEGLDGAGKRTLAGALAAELEVRGLSVGRSAFPRYEADVHAELVSEALHGEHGDLGESVYGMAVLYALDRRGAADELRSDLREHDVVLLDRYVASNAAYGAARLYQDANGEFVRWTYGLEVERFSLPRPDMQVLLQVPSTVAGGRAEQRERTDVQRKRDNFESDASLQERCGEVYSELAELSWWSPWFVADGVGQVDPVVLADAALA